jgi:pimeloyl-ACP methyl ester carboxylesterase
MIDFTEVLGLSRYTLYTQDYDRPVGFRMMLARPDRVEALIVQNAVAHNEGLGRCLGSRGGRFGPIGRPTKTRFARIFCRCRRRERAMSGPIPTWSAMTPISEFAFLSQPVQADIQSDLFYDYRTNSRPIPNGRLGCATVSRASW